MRVIIIRVNINYFERCYNSDTFVQFNVRFATSFTTSLMCIVAVSDR